jgi:hydroxymethylglutaryl-CoA reductase
MSQTGPGQERPRFPDQLRKMPMRERREALRAALSPSEEEWDSLCAGPHLLELADLMVESAVGCLPVPIGIASGFIIDGEELSIPMAVEEPSVIAAASYAARLVRQGGGFVTSATEPVMAAQIFLDGVDDTAAAALHSRSREVGEMVDASQPSMKSRGGGFRGMETLRLPDTGILRVEVLMDVRDAMGANVLNTVAESLRVPLERWSGGRCLMGILSNAARRRRARAGFSLPVNRLRAAAGSTYTPEEVARRIVRAGELARDDDERAVTHNKGIMNGISSLGLLGNPDSARLARVAAALGLAQNLAAVLALVTGGIQRGHMKYHAARLAYKAGARGDEIRAVAEQLGARMIFTVGEAERALNRLRGQDGA